MTYLIVRVTSVELASEVHHLVRCIAIARHRQQILNAIDRWGLHILAPAILCPSRGTLGAETPTVAARHAVRRRIENDACIQSGNNIIVA